MTAKFICTPMRGAPLLTARTVSGRVIVAPWETQRFGVKALMSEADWVAFNVALTDLAGEYTPGASVAVTVEAPAVTGVSQVVT
jgi:hypothetical protein